MAIKKADNFGNEYWTIIEVINKPKENKTVILLGLYPNEIKYLANKVQNRVKISEYITVDADVRTIPEQYAAIKMPKPQRKLKADAVLNCEHVYDESQFETVESNWFADATDLI